MYFLRKASSMIAFVEKGGIPRIFAALIKFIIKKSDLFITKLKTRDISKRYRTSPIYYKMDIIKRFWGWGLRVGLDSGELMNTGCAGSVAP